jgi:L-threonylcarbamoyladenylate synthase
VVDDLGGRVPVIIDGGRAHIGVESTVLDVTCDPPLLLRPGGVTLEQLERALGEVRVHRGGGVARSPGMKHRHYAPKARVVIAEDAERAAASWRKRGKRVRVVAGNARSLARGLFRLFREADADSIDVVVVRPVGERGLGRAVMNRLRKAASRK